MLFSYDRLDGFPSFSLLAVASHIFPIVRNSEGYKSGYMSGWVFMLWFWRKNTYLLGTYHSKEQNQPTDIDTRVSSIGITLLCCT